MVQNSLNRFKLSVINAIDYKSSVPFPQGNSSDQSKPILDKEFVLKLLAYIEATKKPKKLKKRLNIILCRYKNL